MGVGIVIRVGVAGVGGRKLGMQRRAMRVIPDATGATEVAIGTHCKAARLILEPKR